MCAFEDGENLLLSRVVPEKRMKILAGVLLDEKEF
jgi:hypothetical protein